jgi:hypothetical protein
MTVREPWVLIVTDYCRSRCEVGGSSLIKAFDVNRCGHSEGSQLIETYAPSAWTFGWSARKWAESTVPSTTNLWAGWNAPLLVGSMGMIGLRAATMGES